MHTSYEQRLEFLQQFSDGLEIFSENNVDAKIAQALNCEEEGIAAVFKSLDGVIKELAEDEPKEPVLALPAP